MAFTREFIRRAAKESGAEIPKELEDTLIKEHLTEQDAFAEEQVKSALEDNKSAEAPKIKDTEEYKKLKKAFDDYKAGVEQKETRAAKEKAVRAYLESKNVSGGNLTIAMRGLGAEIDAAELDGEKLKDTKAIDELLAGDLKGLVTVTEEKGAPPPANPPKNTGGKMTKDEIFKITDREARRAAIAANMNLFNKGE